MIDYLSIVVYIGTFLIGIFIGAAGEYYALLFTDERHKKEEKKDMEENLFKCKKDMPKLIKKIEEDLRSNKWVREFVLLENKDDNIPFQLEFSNEKLYYYYSDIEHLYEKMKMLDDYYFVSLSISSISGGDECVEYAVGEFRKEFVEILLSEK